MLNRKPSSLLVLFLIVYNSDSQPGVNSFFLTDKFFLNTSYVNLRLLIVSLVYKSGFNCIFFSLLKTYLFTFFSKPNIQ